MSYFLNKSFLVVHNVFFIFFLKKKKKKKKKKTEGFKSLYIKQRNICVSLLRKIKINYYAQLDSKFVESSKSSVFIESFS